MGNRLKYLPGSIKALVNLQHLFTKSNMFELKWDEIGNCHKILSGTNIEKLAVPPLFNIVAKFIVCLLYTSRCV